MSDAVKDQFSEDDWFLISTVPTMVGAAMAGAGKSGIIGTAKEAMASMKSLVAGKSDFPDNEIINGILLKAENFSDAKAQAGAYREKAMAQFKEQGIKSPEEFNAYMLDNAGKAVALVKEKRGEKEAGEYQTWCINVAKKVAVPKSSNKLRSSGMICIRVTTMQNTSGIPSGDKQPIISAAPVRIIAMPRYMGFRLIV